MRSATGLAALRERWSHYPVVLIVFSITGLVAVLVSRLLINGAFGLEGERWSGPWSYRATYLAVVPPFYSLTLVAVGSLFGKHEYFKRRVLGTWSRLIPRKMLMRLPYGPRGGTG